MAIGAVRVKEMGGSMRRPCDWCVITRKRLSRYLENMPSLMWEWPCVAEAVLKPNYQVYGTLLKDWPV